MEQRKNKIIFIVGARPNFMKIAPIMRVLGEFSDEFNSMLVHTGQHYDVNMSLIFFDELGIPYPDLNLEVGSGSHAWQTAEIMKRFEPVVLEHKPDWIFVPGDVNSTLACALVGSKLGVKIAHVEAGLRSFDRSMPEEVNRILTDHLSNLLLTPSRDGGENLLREGIAESKCCFVGNVMIDTLVRLLPRAQERWDDLSRKLGISEPYLLVTLHRPSNVDDPATLRNIIAALIAASKHITVVFPVHPRTRQRISETAVMNGIEQIRLIGPLGYLDFLALECQASLVLTDSGGVQEETTYLGVTCLTARPNTERPVTITHGTNQLVDSTYEALSNAITDHLLSPRQNSKPKPELWDGQTAKRIIAALRQCC